MRTIVLATTVATAYALLRGWPPALHPVLRACFAVLILVLGFGLWVGRERSRSTRARPDRPARWPDYVAIGLGILAIECLFLFFLSAVPPQAEGLAIQLESVLLPERATARREAGGEAAENRGTGNWLWDSQGRRRLPRQLSARPSNKPEVFVIPQDTTTKQELLKRPYIRAFALEKFDDSTWSPVAIEPETLVADEDQWIRLPAPSSRPGPVLRGELYHSAHPAGQDVFTSLQGAFEAELPTLRRLSPGILRLTPLPDPSRGYNYHTASRSVTLDSLLEGGVLKGRMIEVTDAPAHLLETPADEELSQALIDIAGRTQGPTEVRLVILRKYLQKAYDYSLEVSNNDDRDPVTNFLVHEKRGHCELFATAGALLCRTLGVPARVAYGWTGGRYYDPQNLFVFRAREAHAWTEIYLRDIGWVVYDTTPPGALAAAFSIAPPGESPPLTDEELLTLDLEPSGEDSSGFWAYAILVMGALLVPLAILILRLRKPPVAPAGTISSTLLPAPPGYLARFKRISHRLGRPMPPGRTLRRHLDLLADDGRKPTFAAELLDYHYATTYGEAPPDKGRERSLLRAIKSWGKSS